LQLVAVAVVAGLVLYYGFGIGPRVHLLGGDSKIHEHVDVAEGSDRRQAHRVAHGSTVGTDL
jgi:hypothetical protein